MSDQEQRIKDLEERLAKAERFVIYCLGHPFFTLSSKTARELAVTVTR